MVHQRCDFLIFGLVPLILGDGMCAELYIRNRKAAIKKSVKRTKNTLYLIIIKII